MSYIDDRNAVLDKLVIDFERDFNSFGRKFKRMLTEFISAGFTTHDDAVRWFAGTGQTDSGYGEKKGDLSQSSQTNTR